MDHQEKLLKVIDFIHEEINAIAKHPTMFATSLHDAEMMISILVTALNVATQTQNGRNSKKWLADRYPEIPGSVRCVALATQQKFPCTHDKDLAHEFFEMEIKTFVKYMTT